MEQTQLSEQEMEQMKYAHEMVQAWISYSVEKPQVMLGTHLRSMAIITGLAMRMCGLDRQMVGPALAAISETAIGAYEHAMEEVQLATIQ